AGHRDGALVVGRDGHPVVAGRLLVNERGEIPHLLVGRGHPAGTGQGNEDQPQRRGAPAGEGRESPDHRGSPSRWFGWGILAPGRKAPGRGRRTIAEGGQGINGGCSYTSTR